MNTRAVCSHQPALTVTGNRCYFNMITLFVSDVWTYWLYMYMYLSFSETLLKTRFLDFHINGDAQEFGFQLRLSCLVSFSHRIQIRNKFIRQVPC